MNLIDDAHAHLARGPILGRHLHAGLHGSGWYGRLNAWIAVKATGGLSSMTFFWLCVALDLAELPAVIVSGSAIAWVTFISQTVIQLLALPLLGAGQRLISAQQDARSESDHAILASLHDMQVQQTEILRRLDGGQDSVGIVRFPAPEQQP